MQKLTPANERTLGIIQIAVSGLAFGFLGLFGKLAFRNGLSVGELLCYRFSMATLMMALGLALVSRRRLLIAKHQLFICAGLGIFGYAVFSSFYFAAIEGVSVAMAALLLYTYPVLVAVGARLFFKQRLTRAQLLALPLALVGLAVLLGRELSLEDARLVPIACGLAAALCYSAYILVSSRYQGAIDPLTSAFYVMLFATVGLFIFHHPDVSRVMRFDVVKLGLISGIALICTVTPLVLFLSGLQKLGNTEASLLSTVEPITAAMIGSLLLNEVLTANEWIGGAIVLIALVITVLGSQTKVRLAAEIA